MSQHKTITKDIGGTPLAIVHVADHVGMLLRIDGKSTHSLALTWSKDGFSFSLDPNAVTLLDEKGKKEKLKECSKFGISTIPEGFVLTYLRENELVTAFSKNLYDWKVKTREVVEDLYKVTSATFFHDRYLDRYVLYKGGLFIRGFISPRFGHFPKINRLIATSRMGNFDEGVLTLIGAEKTSLGIALLYDATIISDDTENPGVQHALIQTGVVLLDSHHPDKVLWRSAAPIFQTIIDIKKGEKVEPLGVVRKGNIMRLYFRAGPQMIVVGSIEALLGNAPTPTHNILKKSIKNPILSPHSLHNWEVESTFNPAAFMDDKGAVHLLYRAIGGDGVSRVGYAECKDGLHISERYPLPVFEPRSEYGLEYSRLTSGSLKGPVTYNPSFYTSGGSWHGVEDPRAVLIDNRVYMVFVAFGGWHSVRMAITSISLSDFKKNNWNWSKPQLISPPGQVNKNWVLFPEKINGKYAILHSIAPEISVDFVDSLDDFTGTAYITSPRLPGPQPGREGHWDNLLRGAGPPPLKTKLGWLLFYHALDKKDSSKYKLGAMILDSNNPTKILYRSEAPILSPDEQYENNGKPGVVYASGAVIKNNHIYVYYGGADKVVCVATAPLDEFLDYLKEGKKEVYKLKKSSIKSSIK